LLATLLAVFCPVAVAQGTGATGSIQGTVTDPSGAVIPGAAVEIINRGTGQTKTLTTNGSGAYSTGALNPGDYTVKVSAKGFDAIEMPVAVQVNVTSNGNVKVGLKVSESVTVEGSALRVNTEQATVQGVLTTEQIENLPINGRNFLDLAQLEPGVQIQDGSNFDPTKGGFSGISIGGRSGRTTRIELDGQDITDETVGTSVSNVGAEGIQEFDIAQSSLDLSSELTSSGAVNVASRTGTNTFHGDGFYLFRDRVLSASAPGGIDAPYQRNHVGGRFGGPLIANKLFFFVSGEHILQHLGVPVNPGGPFAPGIAPEPFREKEGLARLDWNINNNFKAFYRINYDNLTATSNTLIDFSIYNNLNNTPAQAAGLDFNTGTFTHSIRYGYLKFENHISDATGSGGVPVLFPGAQVRVSTFRSGPNPLAPQATFQSNNQIKYDGSKVWGRHVFRYGIGFNHILGGGFADFFGLAPSIRSTTSAARQAIAATGPFPGGASNPLNYPVTTIAIGNGQGFFTENSQFGFPAGGQFDNRLQWYLGDSWKLRPNLTFSAGLRYVRDTGRTNSDLAPIPCSAVDKAVFPGFSCTGNLLDQFGGKFGDTVRQDNNNFAPQVGVVWDPTGAGKTVFRAGGGMYYDNAIFNNILFSRPLDLQKGLFNAAATPCPSGVIQFPNGPVTKTPGGLDIATQVCGKPIGSVASQVVALQKQFIAATAAAGAALNPQFVGETLNPVGLLAPGYRTPYSFQMNAGVQHQLWKGTVISADYLRNVNLHYLAAVDTNHVGAARFFNKNAAVNAINSTLAQCGAASINAAILSCPGLHPATATKPPGGATIDDFAGNGLGPENAVFGAPPSAFGLTPDTASAFPGINPNVGQNSMFFPVGRSVYNALQISMRSNATNPFPTLGAVKKVNLQVSYSLSRFQAGVGNDQDFIGAGQDNDRPNRFMGYSTFDRTHQVSIGTTFELPQALQLSFISHFGSPLSSSLFAPTTNGPGDIFVTDFTGDGITQDPIPGTRNGSYMRDVHPGSLNAFLANYNSTIAGTPTPAGQTLIANGLFTLAQLQALGGVAETLDTSVSNPAGNGWLKTFDLKVGMPIKIGEHFRLEPSASVYNLFNFVNFDVSPFNRLGSVLDGSPGSVNGTPRSDLRVNERAAQSSSTFGLGSPRQLEFGLKIVF
jgi:hypothetical protein